MSPKIIPSVNALQVRVKVLEAYLLEERARNLEIKEILPYMHAKGQVILKNARDKRAAQILVITGLIQFLGNQIIIRTPKKIKTKKDKNE